MKPSNIIIRIPEPCHEDWNKMQPDAKGKFCNSCSKSVFDFSNKTDIEIRDILIEYKDQKVCGHFKKSQIDRPLNISINLNDLPKNISITKAFAIALFLVFGTLLFSCTNNQGQKVDSIEVVDANKNDLTIGGLSFFIPPPIDSIEAYNETLSGDTIVEVDSISTDKNYMYSTIDGGIDMEEGVYLDSVQEVTQVDPIIMGVIMEPYNPQINAPKLIDSTSAKQSKIPINNEEINHSNELIVYPNPSNGEFTIKYELLKQSNVMLDIYSVNGVLVKSLVNIVNQYEGIYQIPINLNELPNGIYLVNLIKNDKKFVERVVIER